VLIAAQRTSGRLAAPRVTEARRTVCSGPGSRMLGGDGRRAVDEITARDYSRTIVRMRVGR